MLQKLSQETKNRLKVADYLHDMDPKDFNMADCARCICGIINGEFIRKHQRLTWFTGGLSWDESKAGAATFLGITDSQANSLFSPGELVYGPNRTPHPQDAARVMRYLAATDIVDWSVGIGKAKPNLDEHHRFGDLYASIGAALMSQEEANRAMHDDDVLELV